MQSSCLMYQIRFFFALSLLVTVVFTAATAVAAPPDNSAGDTRYGAFGLLDHRSRYGQYWFPEPFRLDETDVDNEVRVDWVHQEGKGHVQDHAAVELEKAFGLTTVELEIPYERESVTTTDPLTGEVSHDRTQGVGNIEISVRRPIYQFVSQGGFFDNTVGVGLEVGIPTNSRVSQNTETVVKMFDALRLGKHFSIQSLAGYSVLFGGGDEGGNHTFEYGMVAGYNLGSPLSHVEDFIPIFELKGETGLRGTEAGQNNLSGTVGVRANLAPIGALQPRLGVGYVFPVDKGARDEFKWGVVTSIVFEY